MREPTCIAIFVFARAAAGQTGPDVFVSDLWNVARFGAVGPITAFAVGTTACNAGSSPVNWEGQTSQHPVITQNMYRLKAGRFEQIGQSWAKHGFGSENGAFCSTCTQPPGGFSQLGVGCSDAYDANTNGLQGLLGPRSQVNATTGAFPYPFTGPGFSSLIDRRLQVLTADITPALNPGAVYVVEGQYTSPDDAQAGNGLNNTAYRQVAFASESAAPTFTGPVRVGRPAIFAWADADPAVVITAADYSDGGITARFWLAALVTDNGDGTWHYEYALANLNAARNAGAFSIPIPPGITPTAVGFHSSFSHSGEPYDNEPWIASLSPAAILWSTIPFTSNPNANALRWGTLDNFRFDAPAPAAIGIATITLHSPGVPQALQVPGVPVPGAACYANCDGSTTAPVLNVLDFTCFLNRFAAADPAANCDGSTLAPTLNILDFICFLNRFAAGCT